MMTGPCDPSVTISLLHTKVLHCYTRRAKLLHCYTLNCYTVTLVDQNCYTVTQQIVTLLYYLYPFYRYISTTVILCISIPFIAISITVKRLSFFISLSIPLSIIWLVYLNEVPCLDSFSFQKILVKELHFTYNIIFYISYFISYFTYNTWQ